MPFRLLSDSATGGTLPSGVEDVRGWPVRDDTGLVLGAVTDAVFDERAQTRFLVAELAASSHDAASAARQSNVRRVLIPIGMTRVGAPAGSVSVPGIRAADLARLPEYRGDVAAAVTAFERRLGGALADAVTDPNALGSTRSSDPDVRADRLSGGEAAGP
jgi:hypothetical protein